MPVTNAGGCFVATCARCDWRAVSQTRANVERMLREHEAEYGRKR